MNRTKLHRFEIQTLKRFNGHATFFNIQQLYMSICLSHIIYHSMTVAIRHLTSMMRQMKKLIAAKPISCARKSRDGDKANCKEQGRWGI